MEWALILAWFAIGIDANGHYFDRIKIETFETRAACEAARTNTDGHASECLAQTK